MNVRRHLATGLSVLLLAALLPGCSGIQSALDAHGREAA